MDDNSLTAGTDEDDVDTDDVGVIFNEIAGGAADVVDIVDCDGAVVGFVVVVAVGAGV